MIKLKELLTESSMVNFGVAKEDKNDFEEVLKDFGIKAKILNARNMPKRIVYSVPFANSSSKCNGWGLWVMAQNIMLSITVTVRVKECLNSIPTSNSSQ